MTRRSFTRIRCSRQPWGVTGVLLPLLASCFSLSYPLGGPDGPLTLDAREMDGAACFPSAGRPSAVPMLQEQPNVSSPRLSRDGLRLYYVSGVEVRVARRQVTTDPFARSTPVTIVGGEGLAYEALAVTPTGLIVSATGIGFAHDLYQAEGAADTFATPTVLQVNDPTRADVDPFVSADGLELVWASDRSGQWHIHHSVRGGVADPFENVEMLELAGGFATAPWLSDDRLTLYFSDDLGGISRATRVNPDSTVLSAPVRVESLTAPGESTSHVFLSEETGEIWFDSSRTGGASDATSLWRAQYCPCGTCQPERTIDCTDGTPSGDGRSCYRLLPSPVLATAASCAQGGHLVSIHGEVENTLVFSIMPSGWIGLDRAAGDGIWRWTSGEPASWLRWRAMQPDPDTTTHQCGTMGIGATWDDLICDANSLGYLCETELWPWW